MCQQGSGTVKAAIIAIADTLQIKWAWPWLVWLSESDVILQTERSLVRFLVRAHAWVEGQVPLWGLARGNHTLMFPSLSPSLPLLLKINK